MLDLTLTDDRWKVRRAVPEYHYYLLADDQAVCHDSISHMASSVSFMTKASEVRQPGDELSVLRRFCMRTVALQLHRPMYGCHKDSAFMHCGLCKACFEIHFQCREDLVSFWRRLQLL